MTLQGSLHIAAQLLKPRVADDHAEITSRHPLQFVRLVEDHRPHLRQNPSIRRVLRLLLDRQVSEKQVMVHDDDVALHRPPVHLGDEAFLERTAPLPQAGVGARIQLPPQGARLGQRCQLRPVASPSRLLPGGDRPVLLNRIEPIQHRLIRQVVELFPAQIVVTPLHVADVQLAFAMGKKRLLEGGDVLVEKLLLQILGAGGNDDAFSGSNHGHEISQRFARAGSGLDDQMPSLAKRLFDGLRHLQLPPPELIRRMGPRQYPSGGKKLVQRSFSFRSGNHGLGGRHHGVSIINARAGRKCPQDGPAAPVWGRAPPPVQAAAIWANAKRELRMKPEEKPTDRATGVLSRRATSPLLAIVGRPNVGKSTLFNRMVGSRRAIVGDEPGITRDRLYGNSHWRGHNFRIVDTGGIVPGGKGFIPAEIFRQARVALDEAAAVIMVVDVRTELAAPDLELARLLQRTGKLLFLAVNKVDSDKQQALVDEFHRLGIRQMYAVSAEHGRGIDDLLDGILEALKLETSQPEEANDQGPTTDPEVFPATSDPPLAAETKVAIIGHPNVGKSTLLNRLTGTSRAIVSPIPGTTRDAVDEVIEREGRSFRFIDTAGIRRKGKTHLMAEKLSVVMTRRHLEAADIALLVID